MLGVLYLIAESSACLSTPFANPLTTTLDSLPARFAILSVNFSAASEASLEPTIATDSFSNML